MCNGSHQLLLEDCDPELSLQGDQKELYSAFSNLAFNAIRHNPAGTEIRMSATTNENGDIDICVSDNGVGIDPKHLPRLTERFYRVDNSRTSNSGGTGLGLAIVKHVLLRHQGQLNISSTPNHGSTFRCRFQQKKITR